MDYMDLIVNCSGEVVKFNHSFTSHKDKVAWSMQPQILHVIYHVSKIAQGAEKVHRLANSIVQ